MDGCSITGAILVSFYGLVVMMILKRAAYSLVELIIIVFFLGVLAAIAVPKLRSTS